MRRTNWTRLYFSIFILPEVVDRSVCDLWWPRMTFQILLLKSCSWTWRVTHQFGAQLRHQHRRGDHGFSCIHNILAVAADNVFCTHHNLEHKQFKHPLLPPKKKTKQTQALSPCCRCYWAACWHARRRCRRQHSPRGICVSGTGWLRSLPTPTRTWPMAAMKTRECRPGRTRHRTLQFISNIYKLSICDVRWAERFMRERVIARGLTWRHKWQYLFTHTTTSSLLAEAINVEVNMVDEWIGTIAGSRKRIRVVE